VLAPTVGSVTVRSRHFGSDLCADDCSLAAADRMDRPTPRLIKGVPASDPVVSLACGNEHTLLLTRTLQSVEKLSV
jgi:hypothetical protein